MSDPDVENDDDITVFADIKKNKKTMLTFCMQVYFALYCELPVSEGIGPYYFQRVRMVR